jgi:hypothetical protein
MNGRERRVSPRKECAVPLRFRIMSTSLGKEHQKEAEPLSRRSSGMGTFDGHSVNLSERGIYFTSTQRMNIGEPVEMFFTIPRELTGRESERVRCSARVVHVEEQVEKQGLMGFGAAVDRFETIGARDWGN